MLSVLSNKRLRFGIQHQNNSNNNKNQEQVHHKRHENLKNQNNNALVRLLKLNNDDDNFEEIAESTLIQPKNNDLKKNSCSDPFAHTNSYAISKVDNPKINMINEIQCQNKET